MKKVKNLYKQLLKIIDSDHPQSQRLLLQMRAKVKAQLDLPTPDPIKQQWIDMFTIIDKTIARLDVDPIEISKDRLTAIDALPDDPPA